MDKIEDIVEAVKFFPSRPGKMVVRLLRYPDPVITLYTVSDPLTYGEVDMTFEGIKADTHEQLIRMLVQIPLGKALCIAAYPRGDLQGWVTKADFTICDLKDDVPPIAVGAMELMGPDGGESHWNLPSQSGTRLVKKSTKRKEEPKPTDPASIFNEQLPRDNPPSDTPK